MLLEVLIELKRVDVGQVTAGLQLPNGEHEYPSNFEGRINNRLLSAKREIIRQVDLQKLNIIDFHKRNNGITQ